jgi:hypothetical protein
MFLQAQSGGIATQDQKAKEALDAALRGLGGADKIGGINSLVLKGTQTTFMDGREVSNYEFEIRILLPDSFVQINDMAPGFKNALGFSREKRLPAIVTPDAARLNALVNEMKDEWAYFLIGTIAKAGPMPLTLSSGSKPVVFTLTTKNGMAGEIEFDAKTGHPSLVRYSNARQAIDYEIKLQDRFSVNGVMFPRIVTITRNNPNVERTLHIEDVQINPKLDLKDFEQFTAAPKPKI